MERKGLEGNSKYKELLSRLDCSSKITKNDEEMKARLKGLEDQRIKSAELENGSKEKRELDKIIKNIRNTIITDNIWLAEGLAQVIEANGMDEDEKLHFAYQGLITTIDTIKSGNHKTFSTECTKNILREIRKNQKDSKIEQYFSKFENGEDYLQAIDIINQTKQKIQLEEETEFVGIERLAKETGFDKYIVEKLMDVDEKFKAMESPESYEELLEKSEFYEYDDGVYINSADEAKSFDGEIEDIVAQKVDRKLLESTLQEKLDSISEREAKELKLRFGIEGESRDGMTREEIGKVFDVNHERVRQIEIKALRKLRHPSRAKELKTFNNVYNSSYDNEIYDEYDTITYSKYSNIISDLKDRVLSTHKNTYIVKPNTIPNESFVKLIKELNSDEIKNEYEKAYNGKWDEKENERNLFKVKIIGICGKHGIKFENLPYYFDETDPMDFYYNCTDPSTLEQLEKGILINKLANFKIPEKQRLQKEYEELCEKKKVKGDKENE